MNKWFVSGIAVGIGISSIIGVFVANNNKKRIKNILNNRLRSNCIDANYNSVKWLLENGADDIDLGLDSCYRDGIDNEAIRILLNCAKNGEKLPSKVQADSIYTQRLQDQKREK